MQIEFLKTIIEDQRRDMERKFTEEQIIQREGIGSVKGFLAHPNILAILGVRRGGKSIFSFLTAKNLKARFSYINFDDERLIGVKTEDLNKVLQAFYELYGATELLIFDEIQNIEGWELFVSRLRTTKKLIITGSSSKLLSGELATRLTGRYSDFTLYPFSFREILDFKPNVYLTEDIAKVRRRLKEYVEGSGFPEFRKFGATTVVRIYEDVIGKDCIRRHKVRNEATFREMANYLISNFSNEFTYSKLSNISKVKDVHTVKNYVSYLKDAFLITVLERYSPKLKQQAIAPKKVYNIDHGFCNFIAFRTSRDIGKIFENIVCIELLRKKSKEPAMKIYYWKNYQQNEVDFVVKEGTRVSQLIQVCHSFDRSDTKERETSALLLASEELRCNNLLIITDDYENEEEIKGKKIKFMPLWKWLLTSS